MEKAFQQIKASIENSNNEDDLKLCFKMITSFKRTYHFTIKGVQLEDRLLEIILNQQQTVSQ